jgi:hypothetical protein
VQASKLRSAILAASPHDDEASLSSMDEGSDNEEMQPSTSGKGAYSSRRSVHASQRSPRQKQRSHRQWQRSPTSRTPVEDPFDAVFGSRESSPESLQQRLQSKQKAEQKAESLQRTGGNRRDVDEQEAGRGVGARMIQNGSDSRRSWLSEGMGHLPLLIAQSHSFCLSVKVPPPVCFLESSFGCTSLARWMCVATQLAGSCALVSHVHTTAVSQDI